MVRTKRTPTAEERLAERRALKKPSIGKDGKPVVHRRAKPGKRSYRESVRFQKGKKPIYQLGPLRRLVLSEIGAFRDPSLPLRMSTKASRFVRSLLENIGVAGLRRASFLSGVMGLKSVSAKQVYAQEALNTAGDDVLSFYELSPVLKQIEKATLKRSRAAFSKSKAEVA